MTLHSLQALTWCTICGAVVCALLLASGESSWPDLSRVRRADAPPPLAGEPNAADRKKAPAPAERLRRPLTAQPAAR